MNATEFYKQVAKKKRLNDSDHIIIQFAEAYAIEFFNDNAQVMFESFHEIIEEMVDFENTDNASNFIIEVVRLTKERFAEKLELPGAEE